jgi:hypothetical protein
VALTQKDWTDRVCYELGLPLPGGPAADTPTAQALQALSNYVPTLWEMAASMVPPIPAQGSVVLQFLYCKLAACDVILGELRGSVDAMLGRVFRYQASQLFRNAEALRKDTLDQITKWVSILSGTRLPAFGLLVHKAPVVAWEKPPTPGPGQPVAPPPWLDDPNSPRFSFSPPAWLWPPGLVPPVPPGGF